MGTRNLTMVVSNGETKIAQYGQWDGYPDGQGATILETLKRIDAGAEWGRFKDRINSLNWLTDEQAKKVDADKNWSANYPYLSRDCGGQILGAVYYNEMTVNEGMGDKKAIKVNVIGLVDQTDFAADSLFCEWAYVVDLDKNTFEVYRGFNQSPLDENDRFYYLQKDKKEDDNYYPVKLAHSFPLNQLPTAQEFISSFQEEETE